MNSKYIIARRKPGYKNDDTFFVIVEHRFRYDIFTAAIDRQLQELNNRFCDQSVELLTLSSTLSLKMHLDLPNLMVYAS